MYCFSLPFAVEAEIWEIARHGHLTVTGISACGAFNRTPAKKPSASANVNTLPINRAFDFMSLPFRSSHDVLMFRSWALAIAAFDKKLFQVSIEDAAVFIAAEPA